MEKKDELIEISFRLTAEKLRELARLFAAAEESEVQRGGTEQGESETFSQEIYRERVRASAQTEPLAAAQRAGGRITQEAESGAGVTYAADVPQQTAERETILTRESADEPLAPETAWVGELSKAWERDSRRYDGGFSLY